MKVTNCPIQLIVAVTIVLIAERTSAVDMISPHLNVKHTTHEADTKTNQRNEHEQEKKLITGLCNGTKEGTHP